MTPWGLWAVVTNRRPRERLPAMRTTSQIRERRFPHHPDGGRSDPFLMSLPTYRRFGLSLLRRTCLAVDGHLSVLIDDDLRTIGNCTVPLAIDGQSPILEF